jgi:hypothetical protein
MRQILRKNTGFKSSSGQIDARPRLILLTRGQWAGKTIELLKGFEL